MTLLELFWGFLKVGLFSFGGAYGAIPLIREVVLGYGWLDDAALSDMIAVSESTPGPIMVNLATYVGQNRAGIAGAAVATAAVVLPAFVVILLLLAVLKTLLQSRAIRAVLGGLEACVTGIVLATGAWMLVRCCTGPEGPDLRAALIAGVLAALSLGAKLLWKKQLSPITLIALSAGLGMALYGI